MTDGGSDDKPILSCTSLLTDKVTAAVTAMPSSAASDHRKAWRVVLHRACLPEPTGQNEQEQVTSDPYQTRRSAAYVPIYETPQWRCSR